MMDSLVLVKFCVELGGAPTLTGKSLFLCGEISLHNFECEANNSGHMGVGHVWIKWVGQLRLREVLTIFGEYAQKQNFMRVPYLIIIANGFFS